MVNAYHNGHNIRLIDIEHIYYLLSSHFTMNMLSCHLDNVSTITLFVFCLEKLSVLPPAFRERRTHSKKCSLCTLDNSSRPWRPALTVKPNRRHQRPWRRGPYRY